MRLNLMSQAGAAGATALQLPKASFRLPLVTAMLTLEARDESSATQAQLNGECSLISRLRWISRDGLRQQQLGRGLWRRTRGQSKNRPFGDPRKAHWDRGAGSN